LDEYFPAIFRVTWKPGKVQVKTAVSFFRTASYASWQESSSVLEEPLYQTSRHHVSQDRHFNICGR